LGVKNCDLDIVVEGNGIGFASDYALKLRGKLVTHRRFGTATVSAGCHVKVDIASARKEFYPHPAHLPVV
jgi:tRNA nucleotidyltransferase (CCA-adding enzyme)